MGIDTEHCDRGGAKLRRQQGKLRIYRDCLVCGLTAWEV